MAEWFFFVILCLSLAVARAVAHVTRSYREIEPGHIRSKMPVLASAPAHETRAEARRWSQRIERVEATILERIEDNPTGVEAAALAVSVGEDVSVIRAILAKWREEIPCRLQITRSGKIYHDFSSEDLARIGSARALSIPLRVSLMVVSLAANLGAVWPLLLTIVIAGSTLWLAMIEGVEGRVADRAEDSLILITVVMAITFGLGFIIKFLLGPRKGPKLVDNPPPRKPSVRRLSERKRSKSIWEYYDESVERSQREHQEAWERQNSQSLFSTTKDEEERSASERGGGGGGNVLFVLILLAVLLAILAISVFLTLVWVRELWRAGKSLLKPFPRMSATRWARSYTDQLSWNFVASNEVALTSSRALYHHITTEVLIDHEMGARLIGYAPQERASLSVTEIMLREGMDYHSAVALGVTLAEATQGRNLVDARGELVFTIPHHAINQEDSCAHMEYLAMNEDGAFIRRPEQGEGLTVNLVGLTRGHLRKLDSMVAGSFMLALTGIFFFSDGVELIGLELALLIMLILLQAAAGTAILDALTRHLVWESVEHGVRRDARRATFLEIERRMEQDVSEIDLPKFSSVLFDVFSPSWPEVNIWTLEAEVMSVAKDLELDPTSERGVFDLTSLRARLEREEESLVDVFEPDVSLPDVANPAHDPVIFDTHAVQEAVTTAPHR